VHLHRALAHGDGLTSSSVDGYNRGFIYNDLTVNHDQRVGSAKINGQFLFKQLKEIQSKKVFKVYRDVTFNGLRRKARKTTQVFAQICALKVLFYSEKLESLQRKP